MDCTVHGVTKSHVDLCVSVYSVTVSTPLQIQVLFQSSCPSCYGSAAKAELPRLIMANLSQPESFFATRVRDDTKVFLSITTSKSLSVYLIYAICLSCV